MTFEAFLSSLAGDDPPAELGPAGRALWLDRKGDWAGAHDLAADLDSVDGARIHAYLHRKEGDLDNAGYWYGQARRTPATGPLPDEWEELARDLLGR